LRLIARRSLSDGEPGEVDGDVEHLILEDDDAQCLPQRLLQERVIGGRLVRRVLAQPLPPFDVRVDRLPLDRARPHERDLDGDVVEVLRARAQDRLHLRAALDLKAADGVGLLDLREHVGVVERDAREVDLLAARARDEVDALLHRREHSEPEQVDLQEAGVRTRVLVPLAHLPARHRRRLHGHELDERTRRDHHPAGVLGDVPRQPADLAAELRESTPARRGELSPRVREHAHLLGDAGRVPAVGEPRQPLEVGEREAERLADVADRAARAVRGEARDERCVLASVSLRDADDELLADVPRKVEVDVRDRGELAVDEAAEREVRLHRVDVREPGEVADERADRRSTPASGREQVTHRPRAAHLERNLARELEHLPVEEEEAGEPELVDQRKLLVETRADAALAAVQPAVALGERALAHAAELHARRLGAVREVGIAVAELLSEVELEPLRDLERARHRVAIVGEPLEHVRGRGENALVVSAPLALAAVERGVAANCDEHVLQRRTADAVGVHVAGRDGAHVQRLGEIAQRGVAPRVAAFVRTLELDVEALAAEGAGEPRGSVRIVDGKSLPRTAGETDEPLVQLLEQAYVECGRQRLRSLRRA
jgi:hypothetical protein